MTVWPPPPRRDAPLKTAKVVREIYDYFSLGCAVLAALLFVAFFLDSRSAAPWGDLLGPWLPFILLLIPVLSIAGLILGIQGRGYWTGKLGFSLSALELTGMAVAMIYLLAKLHVC